MNTPAAIPTKLHAPSKLVNNGTLHHPISAIPNTGDLSSTSHAVPPSTTLPLHVNQANNRSRKSKPHHSAAAATDSELVFCFKNSIQSPDSLSVKILSPGKLAANQEAASGFSKTGESGSIQQDTANNISLRRSKRKVEEGESRSAANNALDDDPLASPLESTRKSRMRSNARNGGYDKRTVDYCQSCQSRINTGHRVTINLHHHQNPFYSSFAMRPHSVSTMDTSGMYTSPAYINGIVSAKPTTAAIPVEDIHLCTVCSGWFRTHRLHCDECYYVPRLDERHFKYCVRCFEGVVCPH